MHQTQPCSVCLKQTSYYYALFSFLWLRIHLGSRFSWVVQWGPYALCFSSSSVSGLSSCGNWLDWHLSFSLKASWKRQPVGCLRTLSLWSPFPWPPIAERARGLCRHGCSRAWRLKLRVCASVSSMTAWTVTFLSLNSPFLVSILLVLRLILKYSVIAELLVAFLFFLCYSCFPLLSSTDEI